MLYGLGGLCVYTHDETEAIVLSFLTDWERGEYSGVLGCHFSAQCARPTNSEAFRSYLVSEEMVHLREWGVESCTRFTHLFAKPPAYANSSAARWVATVRSCPRMHISRPTRCRSSGHLTDSLRTFAKYVLRFNECVPSNYIAPRVGM